MQFLKDNINKITLSLLILFFGFRLRDGQVLQHFVDILIGALTMSIVPKSNPLEPK